MTAPKDGINLAAPASPASGIPSGSPAGAAAQQGSRPPARPQAPVALSDVDTPDDFLDMQRLDPKTVDPNKHYRFVRADDLAMNKARRRGYEVEKLIEGGVRPLVAGPTAGDGAIRFGDTVLMSCPRAKHVSRQRAKVKKTAERIGSVTQVAREKAAQIQQVTGHKVTMITDKE